MPAVTEIEWMNVFERRIGKRAMYEIGIPVVARQTAALSIPSAGLINTQSTALGFGDIELAFKYTVLASEPGILAAGVETAIPFGNDPNGFGHGTVVWEPFLAAGTSLGRAGICRHRRNTRFQSIEPERPISRSSTTCISVATRARRRTRGRSVSS